MCVAVTTLPATASGWDLRWLSMPGSAGGSGWCVPAAGRGERTCIRRAAVSAVGVVRGWGTGGTSTRSCDQRVSRVFQGSFDTVLECVRSAGRGKSWAETVNLRGTHGAIASPWCPGACPRRRSGAATLPYGRASSHPSGWRGYSTRRFWRNCGGTRGTPPDPHPPGFCV